PFASTLNVTPNVVLAPNATYLVSAFLTPGASILGVRVGYRPPVQSFIPFSGGSPRILDTRQGGGKLQVNVTRAVPTGFAGASSAVFNLNVEGGSGPGSVACFAAGGGVSTVPSVRYTTNEVTENLVICPLNSAGVFALRASGAATHAFVDLIGFLI